MPVLPNLLHAGSCAEAEWQAAQSVASDDHGVILLANVVAAATETVKLASFAVLCARPYHKPFYDRGQLAHAASTDLGPAKPTHQSHTAAKPGQWGK